MAPVLFGLVTGALIPVLTGWYPRNWQWWAVMVPLACGFNFLLYGAP